MQISIVVPIYNVSAYLPRGIESVLANDCADCELILVDDGSTDGSAEICDKYAAEHPELIRVIHRTKSGIGDARNAGIDAAQGSWLMFLDSDDRLTPDALAELKRASANSDADVIGYRYYADNGKDPPVPQTAGYDDPGEPFTLAQHPAYLLSLPSVWSRLWSRRLLDRTGLRFPQGIWYEDVRLSIKLIAKAERIEILPKPLYYYLKRPGSVMNSTNVPRNREIIVAFRDILGWYRENGLFEQYREELCALTVHHALLTASVRVARIDPRSEVLRELRGYTDEAFPDWQNNSYLKTLPRGKKLALTLVRRRRFRLLRLLFRLKG